MSRWHALEERLRGLPRRWQSLLQPTIGPLGRPHRPCVTTADAAGSQSPDRRRATSRLEQSARRAGAISGASGRAVRRSAARSTRRFRRSWSGTRTARFSRGTRRTFIRPARSSPSGHRSPPRPRSASSCRVSRLKAVFFVRDFDGNPELSGAEGLRGERPGPARRGHVRRRREHARHDTQLSTRRGRGFLSAPQDPAANNTRIYVVAKAVRRVRFL